MVTQIHTKSSTVFEALHKKGWEAVDSHGRGMLKGGLRVWLIDKYDRGSQPEIFEWTSDSIVASRLRDVTYIPVVLWKNDPFKKALKHLAAELSDRGKQKRTRTA